jgi:RNA polymerase sigma-70 factor (ECF subfamily)
MGVRGQGDDRPLAKPADLEQNPLLLVNIRALAAVTYGDSREFCMPQHREQPLLRFLPKIAARGPSAQPDAFLLQRFVNDADEAAFETLLHRHGPMVFGVCRRVLGNGPAAEDAFQATFLVLVRKARSLNDPERLCSWLYGVAQRTASKARAWSQRRREITDSDLDPPQSSGDSATELAELRALLDQELSRLPEKYRTPMVLCYFEGKTHEQAARLLDCQRLAVAKRLSRARDILRGRLTRRGLTLASGAFAALLAQSATAGQAPNPLLQSTLKAAVCSAAGRATASGIVCAQVAALSKGVVQAMLIAKLKIALAVALTVAVVGISAGALAVSYASAPERAANSVSLLARSAPSQGELAPANDKPADDNILQNPGAEEGTDAPAHWSKGNEVDGVEYIWDKSTAKKGKASLCLHKTANRYFPIADWQQIVEHKSDKSMLRLSAQVKAEKVTKAILDVVFLDGNGDPISHKWAAYIGSKKDGDPPADHDWKEYAGVVEIPAGTKKLQIGLQIYGPGKVWFDEVTAKYEK